MSLKRSPRVHPLFYDFTIQLPRLFGVNYPDRSPGLNQTFLEQMAPTISIGGR